MSGATSRGTNAVLAPRQAGVHVLEAVGERSPCRDAHSSQSGATTIAAPAADRCLWFLDTLVLMRVSHLDGADGISVLEHRARQGHPPPLHVHRTQDEIFRVLGDQPQLRIAETDRRAGGTTSCWSVRRWDRSMWARFASEADGISREP